MGTPHDEVEVAQGVCYARGDAENHRPALKVTGWHVWGQNRNGSSLVLADVIQARALVAALTDAVDEFEARCLEAAREGAHSG